MQTIKIGLLGYGKMGRAIDSIATKHKVEIIWRISRENRAELSPELLGQVDVVIEFSRPEAAFDNVMYCLMYGVPVISGTTGWPDRLNEAEAYCKEQEGAMLWASNFSIGVNLFFALNRYLSQLMANQQQYVPDVTEIHHIHKLDAPSGTALTLVQELITNYNQEQVTHTSHSEQSALNVPIDSIREGEVPGTHTIRWGSEVDEIAITHKAHTRMGFAEGTLLAARWIVGKKGVFSMRNVLGI
jgi:4-hydroxy-tetrahydrodipicolinate reductase